MSLPLVQEFCRSAILDAGFLRRCQREFRQSVIPQLERVAEVNQRLIDLEARCDALQREKADLASKLHEAMKPKKRGRPKKAQNTVIEVSA